MSRHLYGGGGGGGGATTAIARRRKAWKWDALRFERRHFAKYTYVRTYVCAIRMDDEVGGGGSPHHATPCRASASASSITHCWLGGRQAGPRRRYDIKSRLVTTIALLFRRVLMLMTCSRMNGVGSGVSISVTFARDDGPGTEWYFSWRMFIRGTLMQALVSSTRSTVFMVIKVC